MLINMRDPESVARWLAIFPARHWPQLASMAARRPEWREAALKARQLVRAGHVPAVQGG